VFSATQAWFVAFTAEVNKDYGEECCFEISMSCVLCLWPGDALSLFSWLTTRSFWNRFSIQRSLMFFLPFFPMGICQPL